MVQLYFSAQLIGVRIQSRYNLDCLSKERVRLLKKEYRFAKLKARKNPYAGKKKAVGINLSAKVLDYFKGLAEETGLPYQKLIDLYLLDCAKKRKKLAMKWCCRVGG